MAKGNEKKHGVWEGGNSALRMATLALCMLLALAACMCSCSGGNAASQPGRSGEESFSSVAEPPGDGERSDASRMPSCYDEPGASSEKGAEPTGPAERQEAAYPTAWPIVDVDGVPAGAAVSLISAPDFDVVPRRNGKPVPDEERDALREGLPVAGEGEAVIDAEGQVMFVDADLLLVNMPDMMPDAAYDVVYAYAATSNCAGQGIPGVTGERIPSYAHGEQDDAYLGRPEFAVPCAYRTLLKAMAASGELESQGLRLLVYDAYRPMTAQMHLSDMFAAAYWQNEAIQNGLDGWSLSWYVADGASGHNFGTDVDAGVCDLQGNPLTMPSAFDAFDATGHLIDVQMDSASITPEAYCDAVASNDACLALHRAFVNAGFTELASEWWHFGDEATEAINRSVVGPHGLDFVAELF